MNRIRKPHEFLVPQNKRATTSQPTPPCEKSSSSGFGKKRAASGAIEILEDEPDFFNGSQESTRDLPIISPISSRPTKISSSIQRRESSQDIVSTSEEEEDEDVRPMKKRRSLLPIHVTKQSALSSTAKKYRNRASSFKRNQSKAATSFKSTPSSREESVLNTSSHTKHSSQCLVSKDELSDTLEPSSDDDSNTDGIRDIPEDLAIPERKNKNIATPRGNGQQDIKTETTTWMNKLVGL